MPLVWWLLLLLLMVMVLLLQVYPQLRDATSVPASSSAATLLAGLKRRA
jgi:hypothetical protein